MPKLSLNASKKTKHTPAGKIPVDWGCVKLGDVIATTQLGGNYSGEITANGTPLMKMGNMLRGKFDVSRFERIQDSQVKESDILNNKDLLLNTRNSLGLVGKVSMWRGELERAVFNSNMMRLSPKRQMVGSNLFLNYLLNGNYCSKEIEQRATGTTSVAAIYWRDLMTLQIPLPPLDEQRKIADILSTWDEALEKLDSLIAAKTRRKQALMQQLLTGKKWLKGFKGKWRPMTLGDVLAPVSRTVQKPSTPYLAAGIRSHGKGVFLKPAFKPGDIALDELSELRVGDLVVNITFAWEGAAAIVSDEADGALVSHRFPSFEFKAGRASRSFFRHYILSKRFVFDCGLASPGGAGRNRVLSKSAFLNIELKIPPIEEQENIGGILDTAAGEITLLRKQRAALDQQKRGLMQRLLTGKLRVKVKA